MEYNVDYFIGKFSATPEEKWTVYTQHENGKFCAYGHCGSEETKKLAEKTNSPDVNGNDTPEGKALTTLFSVLPQSLITRFVEFFSNSPAVVNNGMHKDYQQPTPKQRILAALYDIKAMQEAEKNPKERIVYVTVDAPVRKLQKEMELN